MVAAKGKSSPIVLGKLQRPFQINPDELGLLGPAWSLDHSPMGVPL
jgi:hypothetical protein